MLQIALTAYQTHVSECPVCGKSVASAKGLGPHVRAKHPDIHTTTERIRADFGEDPARVLRSLHHGSGLTVEQISDRFGYHREQLSESMELVGVEQREYDIGVWVRENPEEHREIAKKFAGTGASHREKNGMEGRTGQDHPRWTGGKCIYEAVKRSLADRSWEKIRESKRKSDGNTCQMCGLSSSELGKGMDVHHIVPIMAGGTNASELLISLCPSCHGRTEKFTQSIPEIDPVLVE